MADSESRLAHQKDHTKSWNLIILAKTWQTKCIQQKQEYQGIKSEPMLSLSKRCYYIKCTTTN